ncbi:MAG TPA: DUF4172 domain-containing protein [Chlamydiales bacterium]|nr:DUF4172 domain-containing protein [Chlamydiales bacterium]
MYSHELQSWPHFLWDQSWVAELLIRVRHQQGRLTGGMESIGFHLLEQTILPTLTQDVVKSSEIEGEILDASQVRSSVARQLGNLNNGFIQQEIQVPSEQIFPFGAEGMGGTAPLAEAKTGKDGGRH